MNPLLAGPLMQLVDTVFDRVLPDKEQATKAKQQFVVQSALLSQTDTKAFRDFVIAYEGDGAKVYPWLQMLRGSVRPVLTYALAGLYCYGFLNPLEFSAEQMDGLFKLNLISLGFWYGERALKNLGLNMGKSDVNANG